MRKFEKIAVAFGVMLAMAAAPALTQDDEADSLARTIDRKIYYLEGYQESGRIQEYQVDEIRDQVAELERLAADHPKLAEYKKAVADMYAYLGAAKADSVAYDVERELTSAHEAADEAATERGAAQMSAQRLAESGLEKARELIAKLETLRSDHPRIAEFKKSLAELEAKMGSQGLADLEKEFARSCQERVAREFREFDEETRFVCKFEVNFVQAREAIEAAGKFLAEREAEFQGDAGQALAARFRAYIEEAKEGLARRGVVLEARKLVWEETGGTGYNLAQAIDQTVRHLDNRQVEKAIEVWTAAKKLAGAVRDPKFAEIQEVKDTLAAFEKVAGRYDAEIKPLVAEQKTQPLIATAGGVYDSLRSHLDNREKDLVIRDRARLAEATKELRAEWKGVEEVAIFLARCDELLARCDAEMPDTRPGEKPEPVAEEDFIPRFEVDYSMSSEIQDLVERMNELMKLLRDDYERGKEYYAEHMEIEEGLSSSVANQIYREIDGVATSMIRRARQAEEVADELGRHQPRYAADVAAKMKKAVPEIVKRTNEWRDRLGKKCDFAVGIYRTAQQFEFAGIARRKALEEGPREAASRSGWPSVLDNMKRAEEELAKACEILPDDHAEAEPWRAKIAEWRDEARKGLIEAVTTLVRQAMADRNPADAEFFLKTLDEALPGDPAGAKLRQELTGAADARATAEAEIATRGDLLDQRAMESADRFRPKYEAWKAERSPRSITAAQVMEDVDAAKGTFVALHFARLGSGCYNDFHELEGEVWYVTYSKEIREASLAAMKRLDDLHAEMVRAIAEKHGAGEIPPARSHYFEDAQIVCEIAGQEMYTPKREVRDAGGNVVGTVDGDPYPVPRVVIRGVTSSRYVIVPEVGSSLDEIDVSGVR